MKYIEALKINPVHQLLFETLKSVATETNVKAYVIGGFVRDYFLGIGNEDIDIVVEGSGIEFAKAFATKTQSNFSYYENYGTAMVKYQYNKYHNHFIEVEFVGARKEMYERGSRNPIVEDGTLEDDQKRRDFTINAMALSLNEDDFGTLVDPFNGLSDLENGIIRTPLDPNITFSDDPLRMFRCVRFKAKLSHFREFNIEENTYNAIKENKHRCHILTQERITEEINKMLGYKRSDIGLQVMYETGLWEQAFPLKLHSGGAVKIDKIKELQKYQGVADDFIYLKWFCLLYDSRWGDDIDEFVRAMKLPNVLATYINKIKDWLYLTIKNNNLSMLKRCITDCKLIMPEAAYPMIYDLELMWRVHEKIYKDIYCQDKYDIDIKYHRILNLIRELAPEFLKFTCPISGDEICELMNITPSKRVGEIKKEIEDGIYDGKIHNSVAGAKFYLITEYGIV